MSNSEALVWLLCVLLISVESPAQSLRCKRKLCNSVQGRLGKYMEMGLRCYDTATWVWVCRKKGAKRKKSHHEFVAIKTTKWSCHMDLYSFCGQGWFFAFATVFVIFFLLLSVVRLFGVCALFAFIVRDSIVVHLKHFRFHPFTIDWALNKNWTIFHPFHFVSACFWWVWWFFFSLSKPWWPFGQGSIFSNVSSFSICSWIIRTAKSFEIYFWAMTGRKMFLFHLVTRLRHKSEVGSDIQKEKKTTKYHDWHKGKRGTTEITNW